MANAWRRKKEIPKSHGDDGRPIFGWNSNGAPVCFSLLPHTVNQRCMKTSRCKNGRCPQHGGRSLSGVNHGRFRTGLFSQGIKDGSIVAKLIKASEDPTYLELQDEMALNAVEIATVLQNIKQGFDESGWREMLALVESIEKTVFHKDVQNIVDYMDKVSGYHKLQSQVERMVSLVRSGSSSSKVLKQAGEVVERRRKLVETEMKRKQIESNHMDSQEVMLLFMDVVGIVKRVFSAFPTELRIFGHEVDHLSVKGEARLALQTRTGVSGIIEPRSNLSQSIYEVADASEALIIEAEVEETYDRLTKPFKRRIQT